ncbi:unnamed protein product, partial [Onchocerca ochengi]|uniref:Uncharacterized protein n=1 Tax=Onchocerca ochengi TaxID=42157 RepID=A0A182EPL0_ONCOC
MNISEGESSFSAIYRETSKPEIYADEKLRQLTETYEKKKKKKFVPLSCCRSTMISSGSSVGYAQTNSFTVLKTIEKEDIPENSQISSNIIQPSSLDQPMIMTKNNNNVTVNNITTTVPRSNTHPLNNYVAKNNRPEMLSKSKLPRRTAEVSIRKVSPEKQSMLLERTLPLQYFAKSSRRDSFDAKKETKKGKRIIERRNSIDVNQKTTNFVPSPYSM